MVSFLVAALESRSLREFPIFNSSLDGVELVLKRKYFNVGFAADTPGGLVVPVIKDADKEGPRRIAARPDRRSRARRATASAGPGI